MSEKQNFGGHQYERGRQGERIYKEIKKEWTEMGEENEITVKCQPMEQFQENVNSVKWSRVIYQDKDQII